MNYNMLGKKLIMRVRPQAAISDSSAGYITYRSYFPVEAIEHVVARFVPQVALVKGVHGVPAAEKLLDTGVPVVFHISDPDAPLGGNPGSLGDIPFVVDSQYAAKRLEERHALEASVIPPFLRSGRPRTRSATTGRVHIECGPDRDLAIQIAESCPHIPFSAERERNVRNTAHRNRESALFSLPNVRPGRADVRTMRSGAIGVLLLIAQGGTCQYLSAAEAQRAGIAVVASRHGALPEIVKEEGLLLEPGATSANWAKVLSSLWHDEERRASLIEKARSLMEGQEFVRERQLRSWMELFERAQLPHRSRRSL